MTVFATMANEPLSMIGAPMTRTRPLFLTALLALCLLAGAAGCAARTPADGSDAEGGRSATTASAEASAGSSAGGSAAAPPAAGAVDSGGAGTDGSASGGSAASGEGRTPGSSGTTSGGAGDPAPATGVATRLAIGKTAHCGNLRVTLVAAEAGPKDANGSATFRITVRYENVGSERATYNEYDWYVADAKGGKTQQGAILTESPGSLGSGELAPGESVEGGVFLAAPAAVTAVHYLPIVYASTAAWTVR